MNQTNIRTRTKNKIVKIAFTSGIYNENATTSQVAFDLLNQYVQKKFTKVVDTEDVYTHVEIILNENVVYTAYIGVGVDIRTCSSMSKDLKERKYNRDTNRFLEVSCSNSQHEALETYLNGLGQLPFNINGALFNWIQCCSQPLFQFGHKLDSVYCSQLVGMALKASGILDIPDYDSDDGYTNGVSCECLTSHRLYNYVIKGGGADSTCPNSLLASKKKKQHKKENENFSNV